MTEAVAEPGLHQHPFAGDEDRAFFGHPRGLAFLIVAEGFWAFAYYGMQAILTLYMTQQLFTPGHIEHVVGFPAYRAALQSVFGSMTTLALASQTYGLATALIYGLPILGGLIGDRWLGQTRTIVLGMGLLTMGQWLLVTEAGFLGALALMILGAGLVKSNLVGQIGRLYALDDVRRTRAFGLYLILANVGGFLAPLVCGTLGERAGWAYGFEAAGAGATVALVIYVVGRRHMPPDALRVKAGHAEASRLHRADGRIVIALLLVLVGELLYFGTYNQAFNIFPVWAKAHVDRRLFGFEFPVTWFSALDGVLTILGTVIAVRVWARQERGGRPANDAGRIATGCLMGLGGFALLGVAAASAPGAARATPLLPLGFFLLVDFGIPWVDTVTMALFTRAAPKAINTTMIGIYYLSFAAGNFLVGWLGQLYERMSPTAFWAMHAAIMGVGVLFFVLAGAWLRRTLSPEHVAAVEPELTL